MQGQNGENKGIGRKREKQKDTEKDRARARDREKARIGQTRFWHYVREQERFVAL